LSRSAAAQLLERTAPPVATLRTTALGYLTGAIPRRREAVVAAPATRTAAVSIRAAPTPAPRVTTAPPPSPIEPERRPEAERRPEPGRLAGSGLDPKEYPWLATYARNLTALGAEGRLDAALGREHEIEALLDILGKRRANNPVLVGEPGVGKTAIVEGLAQRM